MHPLVAETIRYQAAARLGEAAAAAAALLEAAVGHLDEANPQDMAQWAGVLPTVLPHLRAVLSLSPVLTPAALAGLAGTSARVSAALVWGGSYLASLEVAEAALVHAESLGHEHAQVLALRYWRASARRLLGQYAVAAAELRQVLDAQLRVLDPADPSTLATRYEIGRLLADQGKLAAAEAEFRQVLDAELRVLGAEHPSTLATRQEAPACWPIRASPATPRPNSGRSSMGGYGSGRRAPQHPVYPA